MSWQAVGASVVGTSHLRRGLPCQDAYAVDCGREIAIAAVADGLGSAERAEIGSRLAVDTALTTLRAQLTEAVPTEAEAWGQALRTSFAAARQALVDTATSAAAELRDYSTTLLLAAVGTDWMVTGQLGDGAVVACFTDDTLEVVSEPQRGEFANETIPLTVPDALDRLVCRASFVPVRALALFTDGLQHLCLDLARNTPHIPFFTPLFRDLSRPLDISTSEQGLADFLASERVCRRTDDDKTLLLIGRLEDAPGI